MQFPDTPATRSTERIMARIDNHIKPGGLNPGEVSHYNRVYEAIHAELETVLANKGQPPTR